MTEVTSVDGTKIFYETKGAGPALIVIEGAMNARGSSTQLAELLAPFFTVYAYDRRKRGDSGDTLPYSIDKEVQDIEALIDDAGGEAYIYGMSSGGALALEAAQRLGSKAIKVAVYEVPYDSGEAAKAKWDAYRADLGNAVAEGRRGDAVLAFLKQVGMPPQMLEGVQKSPGWGYMQSLAPSLVYDAEVMRDSNGLTDGSFATISAPVLLLVGGLTAQHAAFMLEGAKTLAATIPNGSYKIIDGQTHDVDKNILAPVLADYFAR